MTERIASAGSDPTGPPAVGDDPLTSSGSGDGGPLHRLTYPDGHVGWLATGYDVARDVLRSSRFRVHPHRSLQSTGAKRAEVRGVTRAPEVLISADPPRHTRQRRALARQFSVRGVRTLRPRIQRIVDVHLDAMARAGPPVELVETYALPIPSLVICELLGLPHTAQDVLHRYTETQTNFASDADDLVARYQEFSQYVLTAIRDKRVRPGDDLLSELARHGELPEDEQVNVAMLMALAGHHTTASMVAQGAFVLLRDRSRWQALLDDPTLLDGAIEELLRYAPILPTNPGTRTAIEDVDIGGVTVRAGETVTISLAAANRDAERFPQPDAFDPVRGDAGHLAFGHGIHICIGQHLARVEMELSLGGLLRRFPTMRLAVAANDVEMASDDHRFDAPIRLPVAW
jgi:cytochrome P450